MLFEECIEHPISYSVDPPADATYWSIVFTVQAPDGTVADGYILVRQPGPTTGVVMASLWIQRRPGGLHRDGAVQVLPGSRVTHRDHPGDALRVRHAPPARRGDGHPVGPHPPARAHRQVEVKVTEEQTTGDFRGTDSAKVLLQRRKGGGWVKVRGAKGVTSGSGVVKLTFKQAWRGRTRFRAFANLGYPGRATSPTFVLRTKR